VYGRSFVIHQPEITELKAKKRKKEAGPVIITIEDTGTGIDPEILPRLFTKFTRKSDEGTELGLYISKSIVEAHGARYGLHHFYV
jgi:signal transduction histidine kinase